MTEQRRWVAPPNWPQPPAGFAPEVGWEPDPSWPPAPEGWEFWHGDSASRAEVDAKAKEKAVEQALKDLEKSRTRLGAGSLLPTADRKRPVKGFFFVDRVGLYMTTSTFGRGRQSLVVEWADVVALEIEGSEASLSRSRASYRKSFTVRHTRGSVTTTSSAVAYIAVGLKDDEIVFRVNGSPMAARSKLGHVVSRLRAEGR